MSGPLADLRIVEVSAFVAAPLGGMTLAQLGAEVIRIDPLGGNIDHHRWPLAPGGDSLYWASLNKGKRSVALDLRHPEGQEIAAAIIAAGSVGDGGGILLTNLPASGWMGHAALAARRADLVSLRLTGSSDGRPAMDYTLNCATGFPLATGRGGEPVNHVLPAWDVAAGLYLGIGLLAAERTRRRTGKGQEVTLALSDVAIATVANLGYVADVQVNGHVRRPLGNDLYGAFGRDFPTADGRRVMVVAISGRQWRAIGKATGLAAKLAMIGPMLDVDMEDEGGRFTARHAIAAVLAPWFAARTLGQVGAAFADSGILWEPYQDFGQLVREDARCSPANPMFSEIEQPGIGRLLVPGSPLAFADDQVPPQPGPRLGQDTDEVLARVLGLSAASIGQLHDRRLACGPAGH
jgi:2-methylfumaryl-CoA isomerase